MDAIKKITFTCLLVSFGAGLVATNCDNADPINMIGASADSSAENSSTQASLPEFGPGAADKKAEAGGEKSDRPVINMLTGAPLDDLRVGDTVQFMCEAAGGVPPLTYYWAVGEDGTLQAGGATYKLQLTQPGLNTVVLQVVDAKGDKDKAAMQVVAESDTQENAIVQTELADPTEDADDETEDSCTSPAGKWSSSFGDLVINADGSGTYSYQGGTITGQLNGRDLVGTWHEEHASSGYESGAFHFTFSEDWQNFIGFWNYSSEGPLGENGASWTGTREGDCGS
jgi:hypothetical protein